MKKIIVLGSLNMDIAIQTDEMPKNGETINGFDYLMNPGGKGGNQAVAASKLGGDTHLIAHVGNDAFGKEITEKLKDYKVNIEHVGVSDHDATGVAIVIRSKGDNRIILGNGANHSLQIDDVKRRLYTIGQTHDIFLTQLENDFALVQESIRYAKELGLYTILNPAPARILDDEVYAYIDLLVVNQTECELLTGIFPSNEVSCKEAMQIFESKGVKVIITLGSEGSVTNLENEYLHIHSEKVPVIDTTGAGDSYIGALCSCLAKGLTYKESLVFASKVAAITVTRKGAQQSIPNVQEVHAYFKEEK